MTVPVEKSHGLAQKDYILNHAETTANNKTSKIYKYLYLI